jgi:hypothetical protein
MQHITKVNNGSDMIEKEIKPHIYWEFIFVFEKREIIADSTFMDFQSDFRCEKEKRYNVIKF